MIHLWDCHGHVTFHGEWSFPCPVQRSGSAGSCVWAAAEKLHPISICHFLQITLMNIIGDGALQCCRYSKTWIERTGFLRIWGRFGFAPEGALLVLVNNQKVQLQRLIPIKWLFEVLKAAFLLRTFYKINLEGAPSFLLRTRSYYPGFTVAVSGASTGLIIPCCDLHAQKRGQTNCPKIDPIQQDRSAVFVPFPNHSWISCKLHLGVN